ncbi:MAG TPA: hypothetical protein VK843_15505 [Planctomycetota bacterium]|nr:hypothetical protein [Planctomycetota bacterium]
MKLSFYLCICILASGSRAIAQQVGVSRPVSIEYRAECTLTPEIVDELIDDLRSSEESKTEAAEAILAEHEVEHGWSVWIGGPDFIDKAHAVSCPDEVLDRMAALKDQGAEIRPWILHRCFGIALQRAGRLDKALAMIDASMPMAAEPDPSGVLERMSAALRRSELSEIAAFLCARESKAERAFEYAKHWIPASGCGICNDSERETIVAFQVRMLVQFTNTDEAADQANQLLMRNPGLPVAGWVDHEIGAGRCTDSVSTLARIRSIVHADAKTLELCAPAKRLWDLRHESRAIQLEHLRELAMLDEDFALSLVFGLDNHGVDGHLDAIDVVEGHLRDSKLACLMAATGNPILQLPIGRAERQMQEQYRYAGSIWEEANRRWRALSQKR